MRREIPFNTHPTFEVGACSNVHNTRIDKAGQTTQQNRINWIDLAKGIGIIAVILGHSGFPEAIQWWIWSFHMPLFFFISGFLFSSDRYKSFYTLFKKRNRNLIVPYVFFTGIVLLGYSILVPNTIKSFTIYTILYGWGGIALWFIPVLFLTELVYYFPRKFLNNNQLFILILIASGIGYYSSISDIHYPYRLEVVLTSVVFYGLGNLTQKKMKDILIILEDVKISKLLVLSLLLLILNIVFCFSNTDRLDLCTNVLGNYYCTYLSAIFGIAFIISVCHLVSKVSLLDRLTIKQKLISLGTNTLILLSLHQVIMMLLIKLFNQYFSLSPLFSSLIRHPLLWGILIFSIVFLNRFFPFILGKENLKQSLSIKK
jgi:acyltransferase